MYDSFSSDYDRFVNWSSRLNFELPYIEGCLATVGAGHILDAATGTGMHVISLAQRGYQASGADLSAGMIERARRNATAAGVQVNFRMAGFGDLASAFRDERPFDAILCLGNSLPHVLTAAALATTLEDFAACIRKAGLLLIQNRNFDAVSSDLQRWMEPQEYREGGKEWIFIRFYDFRQDGLIDFNILTLTREAGGGWQQRVSTTQLYPQRQTDLTVALKSAGFIEIASYGGLNGAPFEKTKSANLVIIARKK